MAQNLEDLQQKEIELDLENVPKDQRTAAKDAVGNFIIDEILTRLADGESPVTGRAFKQLSKPYADKMKDGDRNPNLELEGDLKAALGFKNSKDGIIVGIMKADQRPKADGHNNLSGESKLPTRRFIPDSEQDFAGSIMKQIPNIISEFETQPQETGTILDEEILLNIVGRQASEEKISVTLSNVLSNNEVVNELFKRLLRGRR